MCIRDSFENDGNLTAKKVKEYSKSIQALVAAAQVAVQGYETTVEELQSYSAQIKCF